MPDFSVRHIHYPVNPSSDHFHTEAVVPSRAVDNAQRKCIIHGSGAIETVLPPSDHYCIETVAPSRDR